MKKLILIAQLQYHENFFVLI